MQEQPPVFDEFLLGSRRDRAMALGFVGGADFIYHAVAKQLVERLADINRAFERMALIGTGAGAISRALSPGGEGLVQTDPSPRMLALAAAALPKAECKPHQGAVLPFREAEADLAVSALVLHALNDPVGHLVQLRRALRPDGLMLTALFGGQTLHELRAALAEAEVEVTGGLSPRVAPMGEIRDLGGLLQRAGFAMPVADSTRLTVSYETPLHLMRELRAMGETNILSARRRAPLRRVVLLRACEIYQHHFATPEGRVSATFELVFLTGWAPGPDQPKALRPGSAKARLADALGAVELPAGEKARQD